MHIHQLDQATIAYQTAKLPNDLAELAGQYPEAVAQAEDMPPTLLPLSIIKHLNELADHADSEWHLAQVAIDVLPDSTDRDEPEAALKGLRALQFNQSSRICSLIGEVVRYMRAAELDRSGQVDAN